MRIPSMIMFGLSVSSLGACTQLERSPADFIPAEEVEPSLFTGAGLGSTCGEDQKCRNGLTCVEQQCEARGGQALNEPCILTAECDVNLICGWAGFCVEAGERQLSEPCAHDGECMRGYRCKRTGGIAGECVEIMSDNADVGASCDETANCASGLVCSPDREEPVCLPGSLLLNPDVFRGVVCDDAGEAEMPFGMRHALPRDGVDFFATPFPTDLRITSGKIDLRDYPRPGAVLNERDLFHELLKEIQVLRTGWSRNPGIYLRFTHPLNAIYSHTEEGDEPADNQRDLNEDIRLIDLETGDEWPAEVRFHNERNKYICARSVFVHPRWSRPLNPGHSYAVIVLNSLQSAGEERARSIDATTMLLEDVAPRDAYEREAWERYAALRRWIKDHPVTGGKVVGATVFTVAPDQELMSRGRAAIYDVQLPRFDPAVEPVVCAEGVRSPCAYDEDALRTLRERGLEGPDPRDCPAEPNPLFHEIHAKVRLPIFQRGEPPYEREGGEVKVIDGEPQLASFDSVCMAITVPRDIEPPPAGWPVVLYAHGTGGSFRAGVKLLGRQLSNLRDDPDEETPDTQGALRPVVLVEIDQVMHGSRLGSDPLLAPGPLFFNVQNPIAARGNLIQGAFDNFALIRFITEDSDLHQWNFPEIGQLDINRDRVSYHGHSQGGTTGPLFAPFEERLSGAVFSGTAGGLVFGLIDKKEPYDSSLGLQLALQEFNLNQDHPAIHIFQEYFDDVDPINYADKLFLRPSGNPIHMLHLYGQNDTFTPDRGQRSFAAASGATLAIPNEKPEGFDMIDDLEILTQGYPLMSNQEIESVGTVTAVVAQHAPSRQDGRDQYNGHFIAYQNPQAKTQLLSFLRDLSLGRAPRVQVSDPSR